MYYGAIIKNNAKNNTNKGKTAKQIKHQIKTKQTLKININILSLTVLPPVSNLTQDLDIHFDYKNKK